MRVHSRGLGDDDTATHRRAGFNSQVETVLSRLEAAAERERRLELRVAELERRLAMDSSDSGTPSSKEGIGAPHSAVKRPAFRVNDRHIRSSDYLTSNPVTALPMIIRWISEVPSKMVKIVGQRTVSAGRWSAWGPGVSTDSAPAARVPGRLPGAG